MRRDATSGTLGMLALMVATLCACTDGGEASSGGDATVEGAGLPEGFAVRLDRANRVERDLSQ